MTTGFEIGTTSSTTDLASLTTPLTAPRAPFKSSARVRQAVDGTSIGQGLPVCVWTFSRLTPAQREQLRSFCSGASAVVYIKTRTNEADVPHSVAADSFQKFKAVMHWPVEDETRDPGGTHDRLDFKITFTHMVQQ